MSDSEDRSQQPTDLVEVPAGTVPARTKPRVWPLFVVTIIEIMFVIMLQIFIVFGLLLFGRAEDESMQQAAADLTSRLMQPPVFMLLLASSGFSMILFAFAAGYSSAKNRGCSVAERLGLCWPKMRAFSFVSFLLGSVPVLLVSVGVVILIEQLIPGDESVLMLYKQMTTGWAIAFIILIGVLPGFSEELFFRGFMQRRLLERFSPAVAIGITSVVFGLAHVTPHGIALATIIGVWLGVIAWRTNSIWPSAFCHAFINSGWNVYQVGRFQWGLPEIPPLWFSIIGGVVVIAAFVFSIVILRRPILAAGSSKG